MGRAFDSVEVSHHHNSLELMSIQTPHLGRFKIPILCIHVRFSFAVSKKISDFQSCALKP